LDPEQAYIIAAANILTYKAGLGEASSGCAPELSPEIMARLGLSEAHCATVVAELIENAAKIEQMVGSLTGRAA
jgi:hypothetical protein